jgi:hypothetical protein
VVVGCAFCGEEVSGPAGCTLSLFAAPGVKVGLVWLPLCNNDVRYIASLVRHGRGQPDRLAKSWEITCVHDGEQWAVW